MTESTPYSIHAMELGPMENFVYLIHDHGSGRAAVVDPAWDVPTILRAAQDEDVRITDILLTHSHHDHINGIQELLGHYDAEIHLLKPEAKFWGHYTDLPTLHHGGDVLSLGGTAIEVMHTPGHTPGSACYRVDGHVITGDTLFVFGCGRCDLQGGDPEQMFNTLRRMAERLPSDTVIHPGHNYAETTTSTMAEQIDGNPFLHFEDADRFTRYRMHYHDRHRHSPYRAIECGQEMPR